MDQSPPKVEKLIPIDDDLNNPVSSIVPPAVKLKEGNDFENCTEFFERLVQSETIFQNRCVFWSLCGILQFT